MNLTTRRTSLVKNKGPPIAATRTSAKGRGEVDLRVASKAVVLERVVLPNLDEACRRVGR